MITAKIGDYVVNISVSLSGESWSSEDRTLQFLNEIGLAYDYAADDNKRSGYNAISSAYREKSRQLYDVCREHGYYDKFDKSH